MYKNLSAVTDNEKQVTDVIRTLQIDYMCISLLLAAHLVVGKNVS